MSAKSGIAEQVIPLPKGGGAISGIGETFSADLHTGTGNFALPLALPPGRNRFQPELTLHYSTGGANGVFGLGWSLSVPAIARKTRAGVPRYRADMGPDADRFLFSSGEDLVAVPGAGPGRQRFRPRTEGLFAIIDHAPASSADDDRWEVGAQDGVVSVYGGTDAGGVLAAIRDPDTGGRPRVFAWKVVRSRDPFGNRIEYLYERDDDASEDVRLREVRYVDHGADGRFLVSVRFGYEDRPDRLVDRRAGFEVRTLKRCQSIQVSTAPDGDPLPVRTYAFRYQDPPPPNGASLLTSVTVTADHVGRSEALPELRFEYSQFDPTSRRTFSAVRGAELPSVSLSSENLDLADVIGDGLPDLVELDTDARYWRNLGDGRFDRPRPMPEAPAGVRLADAGVQLLDADGDGRIDLLVTDGARGAGYYPLDGDGSWDRRAFRRFAQAPSVNFEDPEVRIVDVTGDGVADVIRTGGQLECFFNDPRRGFGQTPSRRIRRSSLVGLEGVSFADRRVHWADMTGDGLQDLVLVTSGYVRYLPSLGHGNFGPPVTMRGGPRFRADQDPARVLIGDLDGDGAAELALIEDHRVTVWINQSGEAWSEPVEIAGTPAIADMDAVRLVDLNGDGVNGILWSRDAGRGPAQMWFLSLVGDARPSLLNRVDNGLGAVTTVRYRSSAGGDAPDAQAPLLPFPVLVVASVTVADVISGATLSTEYRYRRPYWDGEQREFRGFGLVEQRDVAHGPAESAETPPIVVRTWFHQGALLSPNGAWSETDPSSDYWPGDRQRATRPQETDVLLATLAPRLRRSALRALRGRIVRTETYAEDGSVQETRPFTVTEHAHGIRVEHVGDEPDDVVVFPHTLVQRTTEWERGEDPLTQVTFTDAYDERGHPQHESRVALPRRSARRRSFTGAVVGSQAVDETAILATHTWTTYAQPDAGVEIHGRPAHVRTLELTEPPTVDERAPEDLATVLDDGWLAARTVARRFRVLLAAWTPTQPLPSALRLIGHSVHHYDGTAFEGRAAGELGPHGALTRTESLVLTPADLDAAYGDERPGYLGGTAPLADGAPPAFGAALGYHWRTPSVEGHHDGYYVDAHRQRLDVQEPPTVARRYGVVTAKEDPLGRRSEIVLDRFALLPVQVADSEGLTTVAEYDERVLQPARVVEPNGNATVFRFSPLGLLERIVVVGRDGEGGTDERPEVWIDYDLQAYERTRRSPHPQPAYAHTRRRTRHASDAAIGEVLELREYSDGFGRLVQSRMQADPLAFGDSGDDVGLPVDPADGVEGITGRLVADRVVVSGWKVYDAKGRVARRYEPCFGGGWEYGGAAEATSGRWLEHRYDARGREAETLRPDGSRELVVYGIPVALDTPGAVIPTPWERSTYDANDLAAESRGIGGESLAHRAPPAHHYTPTSHVRDALGRVVAEVQRAGPRAETDAFLTRSRYDLRGNVVEIIDPHGRRAFTYAYDLANQRLVSHSLDAGVRYCMYDGAGRPVQETDARGALRLREYDSLGRATHVWSRDSREAGLVLSERLGYGDSGDRAEARDRNSLGRLTEHRDEAGVLRIERYDFKGNPERTARQVVSDAALDGGWRADWSAANAETALEQRQYVTDRRYDALNRPVELRYPEDVTGRRSVLSASYDAGGWIQRLELDGAEYVRRIGYNARGQRVVIVYGAEAPGGRVLMTRYAYDRETFRARRVRTERLRAMGGPFTWELSGGVIQDSAHTHDLVGNVVGIEERAPGNGVATAPDRLLRELSYDAAYRLTAASGRACVGSEASRQQDAPPCGAFGPAQTGAPTPNQDNAPSLTERFSESYVHDPAGNLRELHYRADSGAWTRRFGMGGLPPESWAQAPSNQTTRVVANGDTSSYGFDAAGNVVTQNTERHFTWDHANRLIRFEIRPQGSSTASVDVGYRYAADGQLVRRHVRTGVNGVESMVCIDGIFEHWPLNPNGASNLLHVMDVARRIAAVRRGPAHPRDAAPAVQYHLADHLGSAQVVVNETGDWLNREEYFPYGETSFGGFSRKRFRFGGRERDDRSGLSRHAARWYAPWLGRWMSCDPAGTADGLNLYRYVRGNPMTFADPSGLFAGDLSRYLTDPATVEAVKQWAPAVVAAAPATAAAGGALVTAGGFVLIALAAGGAAYVVYGWIVELADARVKLAESQAAATKQQAKLEIYYATQEGRLTKSQASLLQDHDRLFSEDVLARAGLRDRIAEYASAAAPEHHIATDKNRKAADRWTLLFEKIFERCGLSMQDKSNLVELVGHKGPHPPPYHMAIAIELLLATFTKADVKRVEKEGLDAVLTDKLDELGRQKCSENLKATLDELAKYLNDHPEVLTEKWYEAPPFDPAPTKPVTPGAKAATP